MTDGQEHDHLENIPTARPIPVARMIAPTDSQHPILLNNAPGAGRSPVLLEQMDPKSAWIDVGMAVLLLFLCEVVSGSLLYFSMGDVDDQAYMIPTVILRTVYSSAVVLAVLRRRSQRITSLGIGFNEMGINLLVGLLTPIAMIAMILSTMWTIWIFWPDLLSEMQENAETIMTLIPRLSPFGFFSLTALVGFYEELIFRGFLLTRLRRATNSWTLAAILSTAAFVSLHTDQVSIALIPVAILSLSFSVVTIWRKSLIPAIIAHLLWNFGQFMFLSAQAGDSWQ